MGGRRSGPPVVGAMPGITAKMLHRMHFAFSSDLNLQMDGAGRDTTLSKSISPIQVQRKWRLVLLIIQGNFFFSADCFCCVGEGISINIVNDSLFLQ